MRKLIVLRGLPASGKSTWAKDYVERNPGWIRVNKDDLRTMLHNGVWSMEYEQAVICARDAIIVGALLKDINVIVDDTNFNSAHVTHIMELCKTHNTSFEVKDFDVDLSDCLRRNAERPESSRVPDKVILDMYAKYVLPNKPKLAQSIDKPKSIIVDLDGTLALHNGRHPFDFMRCYEDLVNKPVLECVQAMQDKGYRLIFLTGREETAYKLTEQWLKDKCGIEYGYTIHMRSEGDNRKDSLVKEEIIKERILPNHYVEFVLDDRQQVVDHLRELGLTVFQVAPGKY